MDLPERFLRHVRDRRLLPPAGRIVIACSGGADSVALAVLVVEHAADLGLAHVVLAHLDHGLRPGSAADLDAVRALADSLGVPFQGERRDVEAGAAGASPEEAARDVRYAFLADTARLHAATHVLTAHHADDQAETVLQRALRGTGPEGLAGIPERRLLADGLDVEIVRPLLPFRREELRELLRARGISWVEDPTNVMGNERARLRRVGIPALAESVGRDPVPLLARLAANAARSERSPATDEVAARFVTQQVDGLRFHPGFERLPSAIQGAALRARVPELRGGATLTSAELERLVAALAGKPIDQVSGLSVEHDAAGSLVRSAEPVGQDVTPPPKVLPVVAPGVTRLWDGWSIDIATEDASNAPFLRRLASSDGSVEIADADRIDGELCARTRRAGDRIQPLGAAASARLGHVLQRRGVPAFGRDRLPLICDARGIVWAAGVCIADRARVHLGTRRIATLALLS